MHAAWPNRSSSKRHLGIVLVFITAWALAGPAFATPTTEGDCTPGPETLCLDGQFAVEVDWQDADANMGAGQVLPFVAGAGYFSYDDSRYLELQVQVLDACSFNGNYWVAMAGLSDYEQTVTVTDTVGGGSVQYNNTLGQYELSLLDTAAIPCPAAASQGLYAEPTPWPQASSTSALLGTSTPTLLLGGGRFEAQVTWEDFAGGTGSGQPNLVTADSGAFTFILPEAPDLALKIFDGSAINGSFWVVFGGPTNLQFELQVTDRCSGQVRTYSNPLGMSAGTVADTAAFTATPTCVLFLDDFESGNTSAWSAAVP